MRLLSSILACGLLAGLTPFVYSQDEPATFRTDARLVVLHATVMDKNGHMVTNLGRDAFKVFENGIQQPLKTFVREDVPISLGLVVDNSGSMRDKRQRVESAAIALVKASNPRDEVFIVNFNDEIYEDVPFTSDVKKMQEGIARIDARGGTAMRDAVSACLDHIKAKGKRDKKVLLVITDGNDNVSTVSLEKLVQKAQQAEVLVYTIALLTDEDRREAKRAKRALDALASSSGGYAYYPKDAGEVDKIAVQVAHEIRNQYILAYTPSVPQLDGSFRQIKVTVNGPNRPVARTRSGYYATPGQKEPPTPFTQQSRSGS